MRAALLWLALLAPAATCGETLDQTPVTATSTSIKTCVRCQVPLPATPVSVLDTKSGRQAACCDPVCAIELVRTSLPLAIISVPPQAPCGPQEVVKVVRTGARWTVLPRSTVFLWVQVKDQGPVRRAFPTQARYIQFLAQHKELAGQKPMPLRLDGVLARLAEADKTKASKPAKRAP